MTITRDVHIGGSWITITDNVPNGGSRMTITDDVHNGGSWITITDDVQNGGSWITITDDVHNVGSIMESLVWIMIQRLSAIKVILELGLESQRWIREGNLLSR